MNRHVEIVGLEVVSHFSKALERILPHSLLKAKCLPGLTAFLQGKGDNKLILTGIYFLCVIYSERANSTIEKLRNKQLISHV